MVCALKGNVCGRQCHQGGNIGLDETGRQAAERYDQEGHKRYDATH
jgi:hypothetical protein